LFLFSKEKILAKRRRRRGGGYEYFIKWVGYDDSANEWIPGSSLNCPERLNEFQLEQARKKKRVQKDKGRNHSRKRRNRTVQKSRLKRRRVKVIDDDDDDDDDEDEDEEKQEEEEPTKSVESSNSSSITPDKDPKPNSITYGVEKGYKVQAILGINRTKGDELHYLVHYKSPTIYEDNMQLLPASIAKKYCEDEIIQFYETRISWNDRPNT
jgi:hypothetical protein